MRASLASNDRTDNASPAEQPGNAVELARDGAPARILVVEDDDSMRAFARDVLELAGFTVDAASHGGEALAALHEGTHHYDLVVLDLVLPWVNGLQVLSAIRHHSRTRRLPVLIITGTAMTKHEFAGERPIALLRKPFPPERLVSSATLLLGGGGMD